MESLSHGYESDGEVPEVVDEKDVLESYAKINTLLRRFELDSTEWSNELYEELNDPIKQNLVNRINVQDGENEFFSILETIDHMPDRSDEFEYSPELLNPFKLDNELATLLSHVDQVKIKSSRRMEKLHASFGKVKNAQEAVIDRIVKRIREDTGLTRIETRVEEYVDQVAILKATLNEKRSTIQRINREKDLSAEELRHKFEGETEERVRVLMNSIEQKNLDLVNSIATHEALNNSNANLQKDLSVLIHQLGVEERTAPLDNAPLAAMNPAQRFRASIYRNATAKGVSTDLFNADVSSGAITEELVVDSHKALEEAFEKQQALYASMTEADARIVAQRKELATLMQSEENKALDRLKKVCDNLQVKIQSDEQRVKVMAALVLQMEKAEQSKGQIRKTVIDMSKGKSGNQAQLSSLRSRPNAVSQQKPAKQDSPAVAAASRSAESAPVDVLPLVRDVGDRESISMKLHRRLYLQFYESPDAGGASGSDTDSDAEAKAAMNRKSREADLPRKRRITASQSSKIQKIMDMINQQYTKLSSVKAADIKHILDYRDFADEIERGGSLQSNSSNSASAKSLPVTNAEAAEQMTAHIPEDHTKLLPIQPGILGTGAYEVALDSASQSKPGTAKETEGANDGTSPRSALKLLPRNNAGGIAFDDHLRIPTTAALEGNEAEFFAQNYGIKLALEHLNAFMEVLTNGHGSDMAFLVTDSHKHTKVTFAHDEQEEMHTVEGLRMNIQKLIALIREVHFLSQHAKHMRKDLQREVDASLKECDRLRNQLLQEIEGSHWPTEMKAGQYELEIEICKGKIKELKNIAKEWNNRVSLKRASNIRLSQLISKASSSRRTIVAKLPPHLEELAKPRHPRTSIHQGADAADDVVFAHHDHQYTVANKRMYIFDDMSNIYNTAMTNLRSTDGSIPYGKQSQVDVSHHIPTCRTAEASVSAPMSIHDVSGIQSGVVSGFATPAAGVPSTGVIAAGAANMVAGTMGGAGGGAQYSGFEEDQGSDGWEDILNGYEGDKSDIED